MSDAKISLSESADAAQSFDAYFARYPEAQEALEDIADADLVIFHSNDVYETDETANGTKGGMVNAAGFIKYFGGHASRKSTVLVTFGGDAFSSGTFSPIFKGTDVNEAYNILGLDYAVPGNHDFDDGLEHAKLRISESDATWLCYNLLDPNGNPLAGGKKTEVIDVAGHKVGLTGIVDEWKGALDPKNLGDHQFLEQVASAKKAVDELHASGTEIEIALTHGYSDDAIATGSDVDIILGGHDHEPALKFLDGALILRAGSDLENIGVVTVNFQDGAAPLIKAHNLPIVPEIPNANTRMNAHVAKIYMQTKHLRVPLATSSVDLDGEKKASRSRETNLGNLVADSFRDFAGADIGFVNGSGLRSERVHPKGAITGADVYDILPFANAVIGVEVTGAELLSILETSVADKSTFLQVSGLSFSYDPAKPSGARVIADSVLVGGKALDPSKIYKVGTISFLTEGGSNFATLKTAKHYFEPKEPVLMRDILIDYLKKQKTVAPEVEGRVRVVKAE